MATNNRTVGNQAYTALQSPSANYGGRLVTLENTIDFSATGNTHAAGDIFTIFQVPAGYVLDACGAEVLVVDSAGNSGTIQLKLGSTAEGSAIAPTSLGFLASEGVVTDTAPSSTASNVNVTVATGLINAVVRFYCTLQKVLGKLSGGVAIGTTVNPSGQTVTLYRPLNTVEATNMIK